MKQRKKNRHKLFGIILVFLAAIILVNYYDMTIYASSGNEENVETTETTEENREEFQTVTEATEETSGANIEYPAEFHGAAASTASVENITEAITEAVNTEEMPTRGYAQGVGSTGNVIITTNDLSGSLEFIPFTTKDGQQFYLLIDYSQSENNVYLLDKVTFNDLAYMAETATDADGNPIVYTPTVKQTEAQEETTQRIPEQSTEKETEKNTKKKSENNSFGSNLIFLIGIAVFIALAVVGITFYKNKMKKVDEDNDEFEFDDEEDGDDETDEDVFSQSSDDEQEQQNLFDIEFMNDEEQNDNIEFIDESDSEHDSEQEDEQF